MTVTKERAMQMFDRDLEILLDDLRGMQAHYQIANWEAFVFLRKPDCPKSYVVKYAAADDAFAKQIVQLHAATPSAAPVVARAIPTAGADGRYCMHHDDDPAHGKECYDAHAATVPILAEAMSYCGPLREFNGGTTAYIFGFDMTKAVRVLSEYLCAAAPSGTTAAPWISDAITAVEKMEAENKRNYEYWKSIASDPTDMGVMKFLCWSGEDSRVIAMLKSLSPECHAEPVTTTTAASVVSGGKEAVEWQRRESEKLNSGSSVDELSRARRDSEACSVTPNLPESSSERHDGPVTTTTTAARAAEEKPRRKLSGSMR